MNNKLKRTPSKKTATKSHRSLARQDVGVFDSAAVCETEPTVRGLLLKTASRFIK